MALRRLTGPRAAAAVAVLAFLGLTAWWLAADSRIPDADSGGHLSTTLEYRQALLDGHPLDWFTRFDIYPPLVRLVGMAVVAAAGVDVDGFIGGMALVFVPLLALGCYGAATLIADERAGALAAVIALGTPMVASITHTALLDGPLTALTALAVWFLLASDRFRRPRWVAAAGVVIGLGMLTKNTFVAYLVGLVAVQLIRGGWREWRGLLALVLPALAIAGPWYVYHAFDQAVFGTAVGGASAGTPDTPDRFSYADLSYYGWALVNQQLYLPLGLVCAWGAALRSVRWLRTRVDDKTPELLAGLAFGWFAMTNLGLNSPRYTLPLLVYLTALGAAAVMSIKGVVVRRALAGAVVVVAAVNAAMVTTGEGPTWTAKAPGGTSPTSVAAGRVTLTSPHGWLVSGPQDGGGTADVLRRAREEGMRRVIIEPVPDGSGEFYSGGGMTFVARWLGGLRTPVAAAADAAGPRDLLLFRRPGGTAPGACTRLGDGSLIFLARGRDLARSATADRVWCPGREPFRSRALAAPAPTDTAADVRQRAALRALFARLRRRGVRDVVLHSSLAIGAARGPFELAVLARGQGLTVWPVARLLELDRRRGAFVFTRPARSAFPTPCARLPGARGIYALPGRTLEPLERRPRMACR